MINGNANNSGLKIDFKSVLNAVAQLDTNSLHDFTNEVVKIFLGRMPEQQEKEWPLIYQIYTLVPPNVQSRYEELVPKLENSTITDEERQEFLLLNDKMEEYSADRLELLMDLATLRKVSVQEVMQQLGLQNKPYV